LSLIKIWFVWACECAPIVQKTETYNLLWGSVLFDSQFQLGTSHGQNQQLKKTFFRKKSILEFVLSFANSESSEFALLQVTYCGLHNVLSKIMSVGTVSKGMMSNGIESKERRVREQRVMRNSE